MKIIFIGSGNVATHLAKALHASGNDILQVYSRTLSHAGELAEQVGGKYTDDIRHIECDADIYVFSVKDDALPGTLPRMPRTNGVWVHTAGSMPMDVFAPYREDYGVVYPLQTFSKRRDINFLGIPVFIEGSNPATTGKIETLARSVSENVRHLESGKRRKLHLAAVFACNFTNHMYTLAEEILAEDGIGFDVLQPLIAETAAKVREMSPRKAQTGPAVRFDEHVMQKHLEWIGDEQMREIYTLLSKSIHNHSI